jgi:hypothetical protein
LKTALGLIAWRIPFNTIARKRCRSDEHEAAIPYLSRSRELQSLGKSDWRWAVATVVIAHCQLAIGPNSSCRSRVLKTLAEAERVAVASSCLEGTRCVHNIQVDRARVDIANRKIDDAQRAWCTAINTWKRMTRLTGWDRGTGRLLVGISGAVKAHSARSEVEAKDALRYLARAIVVLFGVRRIYPETARDIYFQLHMCCASLQKTNAPHASRIWQRRREMEPPGFTRTGPS